MTKDKNHGYESPFCQSCGQDECGPMLGDTLWCTICITDDERLCTQCIEKRLGREIVVEDLIEVMEGMNSFCPWNQLWLSMRRLPMEVLDKYFDMLAKNRRRL